MRRVALLLGVALAGCAGLRRIAASPAEYATYRAVRAAPTLEERLAAADAYVRDYPAGAWTAEVERWFRVEEERYWARSFDRLPLLRAYLAALPAGPHHVEAARRIRELELAAAYAREREARFERRAREIAAALDAAALGRRTVLEEVSRYARLLAGIRTWGQPTSALDSELLHRWRISPPMARCAGGRCVKELTLEFAVPEASELSARRAPLEVVIELERGRVAGAQLTGLELWNRVAEAVTVRPVPPGDALARLDAIAVSLQVVENALEPVVPAARCAAPATSPSVLVRVCDGVRVAMIAAVSSDEEDRLVVEPIIPLG